MRVAIPLTVRLARPIKSKAIVTIGKLIPSPMAANCEQTKYGLCNAVFTVLGS